MYNKDMHSCFVKPDWIHNRYAKQQTLYALCIYESWDSIDIHIHAAYSTIPWNLMSTPPRLLSPQQTAQFQSCNFVDEASYSITKATPRYRFILLRAPHAFYRAIWSPPFWALSPRDFVRVCILKRSYFLMLLVLSKKKPHVNINKNCACF